MWTVTNLYFYKGKRIHVDGALGKVVLSVQIRLKHSAGLLGMEFPKGSGEGTVDCLSL